MIAVKTRENNTAGGDQVAEEKAKINEALRCCDKQPPEVKITASAGKIDEYI